LTAIALVIPRIFNVCYGISNECFDRITLKIISLLQQICNREITALDFYTAILPDKILTKEENLIMLRGGSKTIIQPNPDRPYTSIFGNITKGQA
jgi:hypothetical protein